MRNEIDEIRNILKLGNVKINASNSVTLNQSQNILKNQNLIQLAIKYKIPL